MKLKHDWRDIPGYLIGQRWIATHYGWEKVKAFVKTEANHRCTYCHAYDLWGDCHHPHGRGAGKRDDRPYFPDGTKNLEYVCRECHSGLKQRPIPAGVYDSPKSDATAPPASV